VILWDALNTETSDQAWVRSQVIKYLLTMRAGDPVAVYILVKNLHVIQDFTADPLPLIEALRRTNAEQSADLSAADLADLQSQISLPGLQVMAATTAKEMTDYALRDRVYITQAALEAIAEHLSGLPGRKKLVWISGSFPASAADQRTRPGGMRSKGSKGTQASATTSNPLTPNANQSTGAAVAPGSDITDTEVLDFSPQINHAIRALNGANVGVYPIDPRGQATGAVSASTPRYGPATTVQQLAALETVGKLSDASLTAPGIDTMLLLAGGTGGQAFYATNDATGALNTIMEDGAVTYRLGFYPNDAKLDGSYHTLSVKVARKGTPIDEVGAREGYFALDAKNSTNGQWRDRLGEAIRNPLEATQLGLRASASPVQGAPGIYELQVTLDLEGLHLEHAQNGRWVAAIAFGTLFSPSDSTKGSLETIRLNLTEDRLKAALKDGYVLRRTVVVGDRTGSLRIAIEDAATGAIGSVSVPFGDPSGAQPGL
jgi:VWFA-related protein